MCVPALIIIPLIKSRTKIMKKMSCTRFTTERVVDEGDKTIHISVQGDMTI